MDRRKIKSITTRKSTGKRNINEQKNNIDEQIERERD
jgi:hypothetical protein